VPQGGLTLILNPRSEGVATKPIKTSYSATAGTAYVTFDDVRVPVGNTLGSEGDGIFVILRCASLSRSVSAADLPHSNFNHERWVMCCASARSQRLIVEECLKSVPTPVCPPAAYIDLPFPPRM